MAGSWAEYQQWYDQTGGNTGFADPAAATQVDPNIPMYLDGTAMGWHQTTTPWGETKWIDSGGVEHSLVNPDWMSAYDSIRSGGGKSPVGTVSGTPKDVAGTDAPTKGVQGTDQFGSAAFVAPDTTITRKNVAR